MNCTLTQTHLLAAAVGSVAIALSVVVGFAGWDNAPLPFVWRDVALVCFLAALPLAASIAASLAGRVPWVRITALTFLELTILVIVPQLYISARCRHDAARVVDLIEESRVGEAQVLAQRVLTLRGSAQCKNIPLRDAAVRIASIVEEIERRVGTELPASSSAEQRLGRARDLAMLGQTGDALAVLDSWPALLDDPEGCNLRGTIHETKGEWKKALHWYARARNDYLSDEVGTAGLLQACRGIAYCERKLGHLPQAEAAYHELLALAPTADTHFLLAQFYEDTQQATKAQFHARQAMALDPPRYAAPGQKLIDKLITLHFGCWGAYATEQSPLSPTLPRNLNER
jgi:tetratricopeptide (TPR) repeat protein